MKTTVKMPRLATSTDDVVIEELVVEPGSVVAVGDPLVRVETDKALVEVPSPVAGVIVQFLVEVSDEVHTGDPFVVLETSLRLPQ